VIVGAVLVQIDVAVLAAEVGARVTMLEFGRAGARYRQLRSMRPNPRTARSSRPADVLVHQISHSARSLLNSSARWQYIDVVTAVFPASACNFQPAHNTKDPVLFFYRPV